MTTSVAGLKKKLQSTSQSHTWTKKRSWSLLDGPVWATTAFWILAKSYLRSMLSKSVRCTKNCNACSQQWSTERAYFFSMTTRKGMSHLTNTSKVESIGLQSFAASTIFTWPLADWLQLLQASRQLFSGKTLPQPAGDRKCFLRTCRIPQHGFFYATRIKKLISR